ncbi:MAG: 50S ribosomal protein L20 [Candidatus Omnitrophica bacterium]|nr:50S ribosomal protein L20 [Candidatus Omnitrophota bacterium]
MPRVKRGPATRQRKKNVLKKAKGAFGLRKNVFRRAKETINRGMAFATRDRRAKKREFRQLWTVRINAAAREHELSYSRLIGGLKKANVIIDRKILAELAVNDKEAFAAVANMAKSVN